MKNSKKPRKELFRQVGEGGKRPGTFPGASDLLGSRGYSGSSTVRVALASGRCVRICAQALWSLLSTHVSKLCLIVCTEPQIFVFTPKCTPCNPRIPKFYNLSQHDCFLALRKPASYLTLPSESKPDSKYVREKLWEGETDGRTSLGKALLPTLTVCFQVAPVGRVSSCSQGCGWAGLFQRKPRLFLTG